MPSVTGKKFTIPFVLVLLGLASFFTDMSTEIIAPILPFFIASLGGNMAVIGLIGGFSDALASLLKLVSGYWSDKFQRRKPFIIGGYALSGLSKAIFFIAFSWPMVFIQKAIDRVGKGIREAPRDAIISFISKETQGKIFGIHKVMDTTGAVFGTLLALIIVYYSGLNYVLIFSIAFACGLLAVFPLVFVKDEAHKASSSESLKLGFGLLNGNLKKILLILGLFNFANFTYMIFVMKAQAVLGVGESVLIFMGLYLLYNVASVLLTYHAGIVYDKIGKYAIIIGFLLFAIVSIGFVYAHSIWVLMILFAVYGIFYAFNEVTGRAIIADLSDEKVRGTALGTYHFVVGIVALPSGFIAGYLWDSIGSNAPFYFAATIAVIATVLLLFSDVKKRDNYEI